MTSRKAQLALICLPLLAANLWAQTEPLGRLFFTPQQRATLDRQRQLNLVASRSEQETSGALTINGLVQRSKGRHTTWVNGIPSTDGGAVPGIQVTPVEDRRGAVRLSGDTRNPTLKVGETYRHGSGEKLDLLNGGEIAIRHPATTPR